MRVLAVVAHPDDEVLGAGGALARHALAGDEVHILILGTGATARPDSDAADVIGLRNAAVLAANSLGATVELKTLPDNRFDSVDLLDVAQLVEATAHSFRPEVVYTHSRADLNIDHRITHDAVLTACRPVPGSTVKRLLCFETPSSTEWGVAAFKPTVFVDVSGSWNRKVDALRRYCDEMRPYPHPRSIEAISTLSMLRGSAAGLDRAEAFELVREIR